MAENEFNPSDTDPGANAIDNVVAAAGDENASDAAPLHEVINAYLGTRYQSPEGAINGLKKTYSYVGEYGKVKPMLDQIREAHGSDNLTNILMETLNKETNAVAADTSIAAPAAAATNTDANVDLAAQVAALTKQVQEGNFYQQNPQFADPTVKALISSMGSDPAAVVESDTFKQVFAKIETASEAEKKQSVLQSSPRLGQATDKLKQASEAAQAGRVDEGADLVTQAALEAFDIS